MNYRDFSSVTHSLLIKTFKKLSSVNIFVTLVSRLSVHKFCKVLSNYSEVIPLVDNVRIGRRSSSWSQLFLWLSIMFVLIGYSQ